MVTEKDCRWIIDPIPTLRKNSTSEIVEIFLTSRKRILLAMQIRSEAFLIVLFKFLCKKKRTPKIFFHFRN